MLRVYLASERAGEGGNQTGTSQHLLYSSSTDGERARLVYQGAAETLRARMTPRRTVGSPGVWVVYERAKDWVEHLSTPMAGTIADALRVLKHEVAPFSRRPKAAAERGRGSLGGIATVIALAGGKPTRLASYPTVEAAIAAARRFVSSLDGYSYLFADEYRTITHLKGTSGTQVCVLDGKNLHFVHDGSWDVYPFMLKQQWKMGMPRPAKGAGRAAPAARAAVRPAAAPRSSRRAAPAAQSYVVWGEAKASKAETTRKAYYASPLKSEAIRGAKQLLQDWHRSASGKPQPGRKVRAVVRDERGKLIADTPWVAM